MVNKLVRAYQKTHNISDSSFKSYYDISDIEIHDGSLLAEFDEFEKAIQLVKNEYVVIHGDYDVDGITGGIIAKVSCDELGLAKDTYVYPPKAYFGYGLSVHAVDDIYRLYPHAKYILTVDNGINTKEAVDYALETYGIQVIVTDHHKPKEGMFPDKALAVINTNRVDKKDNYPFKGISGAETIWKLMLAYAKRNNPEKLEIIQSLKPFAGISIIGDVMPVIDENRRILRETIDSLNFKKISEQVLRKDVGLSYKLAFRGLYDIIDTLNQHGKIKDHLVDYDTIGFYISPMINSPRRMVDDATLAFEVFQTGEGADLLFEMNEQRKEEVRVAHETFRKLTNDDDLKAKKGIVYYNDGLRGGIAGLIASKIVEEYFVPTIVLGEGFVGSGRSPLTFNLYEILENVEKIDPQVYVKYGGHEQAAGLTLTPSKLDDFAKLFNEESRKNGIIYQNYETVTSEKSIKLDLNDLPSVLEVEEALSEFEKLKPYSTMVPEPKFEVSFEFTEDNVRFMGSHQQHVKFIFDGLELIIWGQGDKILNLDFSKKIKLSALGHIMINEFRGRKTPQITSQFISVEYEE